MRLLTSITNNNTGDLIHVAFADVLTGVGKIHKLMEWWKNVLYYGPYLGYYISESISQLITTEEYIRTANETFQEYNINITTDGHHHLSSVVGSNENKEEYIITKVVEQVKQQEILTNFTYTEP